jgi:isochorismate synthase
MTTTAPAMEDGYRQDAPDHAQFLFASQHRAVQAHGVAERITLPVDPDGRGDARFQRHVADALERARARGTANPIVIGAIPFDLSQPTCLAIPQQHAFFARATPAPPRAPHAGRVPTVRHARSLPDKARFMQAVQQVIANFHYSDIRKAVLSRILEVELDVDVDVTRIFDRLRAQNPSAYHFRMPLPDGGELIGASPELLVRKHDGRIYSNPLAGSAKRLADPELDRQAGASLLQSDKDAYEHSLVIDDVHRVLRPLCRELDVPAHPSLINTASMWHLSTHIEGVLADDTLGALALACKLHPTPAVCGFPTRQALKLISLVEPFERGLFSGMVGWCDARGNGEWAVTIRCGRVHDKRIELFAGAGIVGDSSPEMEWAETQAKLQTMLAALGVELPRLQVALSADEVTA